MVVDSINMSPSIKSSPYSLSDNFQLKDEIVIKDDALTFEEKCHNVGVYCYNSKYQEVCGRDGIGWLKLGLSYFTWMILLAGIFASLLGIFMAVIDKQIPTFRGNSSALALDTNSLNPGNVPLIVSYSSGELI
ncbi:unnamed protein product [Didymodactylos carnosus]|uniref:Uncharacterized protein n=1 Tax=Didymodactylos carnosus TaxID=1234261 RepID=A0A8S2RYQ3_9BILA|nr:unnamed protein product [Didymodactylos carnosus]CAF4193861.1 unnamed protein product [Didymodactylos carnosus]